MSGVDLDTRVETYTVKIRGAVQGVGFRHAAVRRAHALQVRGWIANHDDGSVEAVVQGPANQVDLMLEFLRRGPPRAKVSEFIANEGYSERRYDRFEQH
ncbi:acylphosphatase [Mycetohabitans sp. B8]|uniref:acylphosphatase n=1 Tax=Mycetohabitans sp. B8 TaxID=2841845 RepID=UPI001F2EB47E|nr:acylphosphatase [Mycetohabitans sp. B8]MCG1042763.1 acylphosphatase [Mycetohabitans sp. B8]